MNDEEVRVLVQEKDKNIDERIIYLRKDVRSYWTLTS